MKTGFSVFIAFLFVGVMVITAWIDGNTLEIPDFFVGILFGLGVCSVYAMPEIPLLSRFLGIGAGALPFLLVTLLIPGAFGGGDIKLLAAGGFFLGWRGILCAEVIAVISGGLWGFWMIYGRKADKKGVMAFGPFLCLGMVCAFFWGEHLISGYMALYF